MTTRTAPRTLVPAGTWVADPSHSEVSFATRHMGLVTVRGRFLTFQVRLFGGEEPMLLATVAAASATTFDADRDLHLRSPEFLDAAAHPEITFGSLAVEEGADGLAVRGVLTVRGVSREVAVRAEVSAPATDPWGDERLGVRLDARIDRRDFGITWNEAIPGGGMLVAHEVRLSAELSLVRED